MKDSEVTDIESMIEQLWAALEDAQEILEELSASMSKSEKTLEKTKLSKSQKPSKKTYRERLKREKMRPRSAHAKS